MGSFGTLPLAMRIRFLVRGPGKGESFDRRAHPFEKRNRRECGAPSRNNGIWHQFRGERHRKPFLSGWSKPFIMELMNSSSIPPPMLPNDAGTSAHG